MSDRFEFHVMELPKPNQQKRIADALKSLKGAIVILLKRAYLMMNDRQIDLLRRMSQAVLIDHLDASFHSRALAVADVHIAASQDGAEGLRTLAAKFAPSRNVQIAYVPHHADPRIGWMDFRQAIDLRIGYFGLPEHAVIPDTLRARLDLPAYEAGAGMAQVLAAMPRANVHYAVRPPKSTRNSWKPFTKGINAAAAGANVLVHRGVDDATAFLGDSYPFMIDSAAPKDIALGVHRLEQSLGTPEWGRGLEAMSALRDCTSPARVARHLAQAIERAF